jgi:hypothetical protein
MKATEFCYWLQGFFEIGQANNYVDGEPGPLTAEQVKVIQNHLALVFHHDIDPSYAGC